jgi:nucleoside-diphosphate-sugar epimerase
VPNDRRILVTGGAGYVGSHVTRLLLERGYRVRVFDKLAWGRGSVADLAGQRGFELYEGDICHIEDLVEGLEGCAGAIHLAGIVGDPACDLDPDATYAVNLEATRAIVNVARYRGLSRFVFASTCSVYGAAGESWIDETTPVQPASLYAETNVQSEELILDGFRDADTLATVMRLGTVFGSSARMRFDLVVNIMTAKAVSEGVINVHGGDQWRPNVHAHDVARAALACLEGDRAAVDGEIFNVGADDQNHRVAELGEIVASSVPGSKIDVSAEAPDPRSYRVSFEKIQRVLGFGCERSVASGVEEVAAALRDGTFGDFRDDRYYNVRYRYR